VADGRDKMRGRSADGRSRRVETRSNHPDGATLEAIASDTCSSIISAFKGRGPSRDAQDHMKEAKQ
jgi:hypothetical protein